MTTGRWFLGAIATLVLSGTAYASAINTLYNTGVNFGGSPLPNGTVGDPHYVLTTVPGGTTTVMVRTSAGSPSFPIPPWLPDDFTSAWIGPDNDQSLDGPASPANYDYRTTFDLTGFIPASALLTGRWSADDAGVNILINGVSTGITAVNFTSWTTFAITTGFVAGVNTLDFIVRNQAGPQTPTGLRVEISGTGTLATPEPASLVLMGAGLAALTALRRRVRC